MSALSALRAILASFYNNLDYIIMNNSKNQAYQQKILQLLLREKAVEAVNNTLTRENSTLKEKIAAIHRSHEAELRELREQLQSNISKAEMEIRIAKRGRSSQEEKREELEGQVDELTQTINKITLERHQFEERNKTLQRQFNDCQEDLSQKTTALLGLEQRYKKQEEILRKLNQKNESNQLQIEQLFTQKSNLTKVVSKLLADISQTKQLYEDALQRIETFKNEVAAKNKIKLQKQGENSKYEAMLQQLTKENSLLRERKKKLEEDVKLLQQEKEQSQDAFKRAQKLNKKSKEAIADHEAKIKELQDQCATLGDKSRNLDRALKAAKRELQQLQQNLQSLEDSRSAEANRYRKYQSLTKAQKTELTDREQQLQDLQQASAQLKKQVETSQRNALQLSLQVERLGKENRYLSEQSQEQQEKRILLQGEKEKAISVIIRDKDVLSRANFKLLQLLELKDQAIKAILDSVENKTDRIDVAPMLDCDQLLKTIRSVDKQKLRNSKERVILLDEWIKNKK